MMTPNPNGHNLGLENQMSPPIISGNPPTHPLMTVIPVRNPLVQNVIDAHHADARPSDASGGSNVTSPTDGTERKLSLPVVNRNLNLNEGAARKLSLGMPSGNTDTDVSNPNIHQKQQQSSTNPVVPNAQQQPIQNPAVTSLAASATGASSSAASAASTPGSGNSSTRSSSSSSSGGDVSSSSTGPSDTPDSSTAPVTVVSSLPPRPASRSSQAPSHNNATSGNNPGHHPQHHHHPHSATVTPTTPAKELSPSNVTEPVAGDTVPMDAMTTPSPESTITAGSSVTDSLPSGASLGVASSTADQQRSTSPEAMTGGASAAASANVAPSGTSQLDQVTYMESESGPASVAASSTSVMSGASAAPTAALPLVSSVAIDNKIEQAMDLVKSHLMFAVREEVDVLKEKIVELLERIQLLETENTILKQAHQNQLDNKHTQSLITGFHLNASPVPQEVTLSLFFL